MAGASGNQEICHPQHQGSGEVRPAQKRNASTHHRWPHLPGRRPATHNRTRKHPAKLGTIATYLANWLNLKRILDLTSF